MDSVTHIVAGAAIGEATLGRRIGGKAMLAGALLASLPDLDYVIGHLLDELDRLSFHRGYTHSILGLTVATPVLGVAIKRMLPGEPVRTREWSLLAFLALFSHVVLDCMTTYGVQLFLPFSRSQVAFSNISIIDPMFTLPIVTGVIGVLIYRRKRMTARRFLLICSIISATYLGWTIAAKSIASSNFRQAFERQQIEPERFATKPTLFNSFLWRGIGQTGAGYYIGLWSMFDGNRPITLEFVPGNHEWISPLKNESAVRELIWLTQGYYVITEEDGTLVFNDMRFGRAAEWAERETGYVFSYRILPATESGASIELVDRSFRRSEDRPQIGEIIRRILNR